MLFADDLIITGSVADLEVETWTVAIKFLSVANSLKVYSEKSKVYSKLNYMTLNNAERLTNLTGITYTRRGFHVFRSPNNQEQTKTKRL